jgi:hypothetical protein
MDSSTRLECVLEEMHIKLSSLVADLLGPSARRMLVILPIVARPLDQF